MRFFNTTGPANPAEHYCIPPLGRFDPDEILRLIEQKRYLEIREIQDVAVLETVMKSLETADALEALRRLYH